MLTRDEPSKEESFWPFGPTSEAVASFDTSGFFSGFGGATSEDHQLGSAGTGDSDPHHWYPENVGPCLIMAVMLHYAWLTLDGFLYN